jgi:FkbM family methyltransferase
MKSVDGSGYMAITIFKRYSSILSKLLHGNYTVSLALACAIPTHLNSFLPKRVTLPEGIKLILNNPATLRLNIREDYDVQEYYRCKEFVPSKGNIVFDIGAYVGIYTLRNAKRVGDNGLVCAFEPNPSAFKYLVTNAEINKINNAKFFHIALGDQTGTLPLYTHDGIHIESSSVFESHLEKWAGNFSKIEVNMDKLDNVIERLGISKIDIAKIDVEGAECMVLRGSKEAMSEGVIKKFVIEAHEDVIPLDEILKLLRSFNYHIRHVLTIPSQLKSIIYANQVR